MKWHLLEAQRFAAIDRELEQKSDGDADKPTLAPAEYEVMRRVIYETADFDYRLLLHFSERSLSSGAAALASRSPIVVDVPMVQVGIAPAVESTFANPLYCAADAIARPQQHTTAADWGMKALAPRYGDGIFIVGQCPFALNSLLELIESQAIEPALVIATPTVFEKDELGLSQRRLAKANIPHVTTRGRKGNPTVAVAVARGAIDLAWQAYSQTIRESV